MSMLSSLRWLRGVVVAVVCGSAASIVACDSSSDDEPTNVTPLIRSVTISPGPATLAPGTTIRFTAAVSNFTGDTSVVWQSFNEGVATVSDGVVTAIANGTADIVAMVAADPVVRASVKATVRQ